MAIKLAEQNTPDAAETPSNNEVFKCWLTG
jgi:hypothetical protein